MLSCLSQAAHDLQQLSTMLHEVWCSQVAVQILINPINQAVGWKSMIGNCLTVTSNFAVFCTSSYSVYYAV